MCGSVAVSPFHLNGVFILVHDVAYSESNGIYAVGCEMYWRCDKPIVAGCGGMSLIAHCAIACNAIGPPGEAVVVRIDNFKEGQCRSSFERMIPVGLDCCAGYQSRGVGPTSFSVAAYGSDGIRVAAQLSSRHVVGARCAADACCHCCGVASLYAHNIVGECAECSLMSAGSWRRPCYCYNTVGKRCRRITHSLRFVEPHPFVRRGCRRCPIGVRYGHCEGVIAAVR